MRFIFFTSIEIIFSLVLILEIKNESRLMAFEDKILCFIKKRLRKPIDKKQNEYQFKMSA